MTGFVEFDASKIKLNKIYESKEINKSFSDIVSDCTKTKDIYGEFKFPEYLEDRPYTFGSFVMSIDGKIAYNESPDGTLIARSNYFDADGGLADYWILNLLRSVSDAVLMGAQTIKKEPDLTGRVYDEELQKQRLKDGLCPIPIHVIVSSNGAGIPVNHRLVTSDQVPTIILTSPDGFKNLQNSLTVPFMHIPYTDDIKLDSFSKGKLIITTGSGSTPSVTDSMRALKKLGINRMLIESPMYLSLLMREKMLDELFLNTSSVFIGGEGLSIAKYAESFTVEEHPHPQVISIHSHSDFFFYTRYKILYNK